MTPISNHKTGCHFTNPFMFTLAWLNIYDEIIMDIPLLHLPNFLSTLMILRWMCLLSTFKSLCCDACFLQMI